MATRVIVKSPGPGPARWFSCIRHINRDPAGLNQAVDPKMFIERDDLGPKDGGDGFG